MELHQTGVIGTSLKKDEQRVPIHPDHFEEIAPELRARLIFEEGYGAPFGITDAHIASLMGGRCAARTNPCRMRYFHHVQAAAG